MQYLYFDIKIQINFFLHKDLKELIRKNIMKKLLIGAKQTHLYLVSL